jgi:CRISPR-associated endonuclease/helicase Cas3
MKTTTLAWLPSEDEEEASLSPHRVEDLRGGKRGEKLYVPAKELLHELSLNVAQSISRWGEFVLPALVREQAEAQGRPLERVAEKFTTVEVPESTQGWLWHPWLGYIKKR